VRFADYVTALKHQKHETKSGPFKHVLTRFTAKSISHIYTPLFLLSLIACPTPDYLTVHELSKTSIMSSAMISQTLQGVILSMTSNVLAQAISSYKDSVSILGCACSKELF
jgi:hypothetical protein